MGRVAMRAAPAIVAAFFTGFHGMTVPLACAQARPRNVLENGGFEIDANGDGQPDHWRFAWKNTHSGDSQRSDRKERPDVAWDKTTFCSGTHSIRVGVARKQDDGVWTQDGIRHIDGTRIYRLSAAIKTRALHDTDARVAVVFLGDHGKWLGADYSAIAAVETHDWTRYVRLVEVPAGTQRLRVRCWVNMRNTGTGTAWFDDVELVPTNLTKRPGMQYVDDASMPPVSAAERRRGFVCFRRNPLRLVFPATVPPHADVGAPLAGFAARGEYESLSFGIRAWRQLEDVRVTVSDLIAESGRARIPASAVRVRPVRYLPKKGQSRWGPFADGLLTVPLFLQDRPSVDIAADTSQWFWVDVHVPDDAPAGLYRGQLAIEPSAGDGANIAISVEVLPFRLLEPPDGYFGMYCKVFRDMEAFRRHCRDMREHGMTTLGLCCPLDSSMAFRNGRVQVRFDGTGVLERALDVYRDVGFPAPVVWLMGSDVLRWCSKQGDPPGSAFASCYRQIIEAILAESKRRAWPEIIFQPVDEPFEHTQRLADARRCLEVLKQIPGVRTEEDGPNGNPETLEELYELSDVLVYHDGPVLRRGHFDAAGWEAFLGRLRRDGKEVWFYNIDLTAWHPEVMRFGYGFGLWQAGGTGMIEWCYDWHRDGQPETAYRPTSITFAYPPTATETGGPTIGWQAIREGVDDFKYLYTLVAALEQKDMGPGSRAAQIRDELLERLAQIDFRGSCGSAAQGDWTGRKTWTAEGAKAVSGDWKMANGLGFGDYDRLRRKLADWIMELGAPTEPPRVPLARLICKWRRSNRRAESEPHAIPRSNHHE